MNEYHVTLVISDCTSVDAHDEVEAVDIATDIFRESGYDMDRPVTFKVEKGDPV